VKCSRQTANFLGECTDDKAAAQNAKEAAMFEADPRLHSFASVDRARSVLTDATSLDALTSHCDEVLERYGRMGMPFGPTLANTIQALVIYEFIYADSLLFEKEGCFTDTEKAFPDVVRRLFIRPDLRGEIASDMRKLGNDINFHWTNDLEDKRVSQLLNVEESSEKPLLDDLSRLPAIIRLPPDLVGDHTLDMWGIPEPPITAQFPDAVIRSSQTPHRAFWYLRLSQEVGLPLAASPARSAYFKSLLQDLKKKIMSSDAEYILQMFDKSVVSPARLKKWQQTGINVDEITIPPVADYVIQLARKKQIPLVAAITEVRNSSHAKDFRAVCGDIQDLALSGTRASLLARERALRKLKDLSAGWAKAASPETNNKARTISICTLARGLGEILPYFGIVGARPLIGGVTHSLKGVGIDRLKLRLPWTRRGLRGELFLSDIYRAPDPL